MILGPQPQVHVVEIHYFAEGKSPAATTYVVNLSSLMLDRLETIARVPSLSAADSTSFIRTRWFEVVEDGVSGTEDGLCESLPGKGL